MNKLRIITAGLCVSAMALALVACGGGGNNAGTTAAPAETQAAAPAETTAAAPAETQAAAPAETTAAQAEATTAAAASGDLSNPDVLIEYGDADAISDLAKKAQNFEVAEGTVAKISGVLSTDLSTPSIQEPIEGGSVGLSMYVDGDWTAPANGSDIEAVGTFTKGQYFMEFHVSPENITVLSDTAAEAPADDSAAASDSATAPANSSEITEEEALAIALADAGLAEPDVTIVKVAPDTDDGFLKFEVEFIYGDKEYSYDIDAEVGVILDKDIDSALDD